MYLFSLSDCAFWGSIPSLDIRFSFVMDFRTMDILAMFVHCCYGFCHDGLSFCEKNATISLILFQTLDSWMF